ncbi:hypothetical protein FEM48_Zijuj10G0158600 [Ziziphus jujuba var. spinosa]|uniref:Uncharacterized protein n=1 Tax=Ziziphus jujuba var. spinosa TaxID=714518 RepID=A0A978UPA8_ZIZJJ|nr:hypothetical protein FEM48_Zijuj10G0158600 [Ziziphus jujuba var. spinosa]
MEFWNKMIFPVRRVWLALSSRVNYSPKSGIFFFLLLLFFSNPRKHKFIFIHSLSGGLLKLRDDVQTCGYEDVQVMWEMLRRSETEPTEHRLTVSILMQIPNFTQLKLKSVGLGLNSRTFQMQFKAKFGNIQIRSSPSIPSATFYEGIPRICKTIEGFDDGVLVNNVGIFYPYVLPRSG